jgi:hypothetical protein
MASDQSLQDAIQDQNVVVNVKTTTNNTYQSIDGSGFTEYLRGGAYDGSQIDGNGLIQTSQVINLAHFEAYTRAGGGSVGLSVLHEVNESYIGGNMFPGHLLYDPEFIQAHNATLAIDPPQPVVNKFDYRTPFEQAVGWQGANGVQVCYRIYLLNGVTH